MAAQLWNTYRSRWLGRFWQEGGLRVIPTVNWSDQRSFTFCFDGIETSQILSIGTADCRRGHDRAPATPSAHRLRLSAAPAAPHHRAQRLPALPDRPSLRAVTPAQPASFWIATVLSSSLATRLEPLHRIKRRA
ncbi:hypothetical protein CCR96_03275 [Halochromatium roseum]|nr:hypothetical protein [Halochromatium roseum]